MQNRIVTRAALVALALAAVAATAGAQQESTTWNWTGEIGNGRTVHLRSVNGEVRFEQGTGNTVEVRAVKRWRRGDPDDVRIEARMTGSGNGDVLICALWDDRGRCEVDNYRGGNDVNWRRGNDVSVDFTVRVPAHVMVDASTVNGDLIISGTTGAVRARTVNGDVEARSSTGRVSAETVNGSITVRTTVSANDDIEYETVNGSITIELPANTNANVEMRTVNGRISSEFPLTLEGSINPRRIRASIGSGGAELRARTVNGSIRLERH
ncbi:MAG: DUF4097 family beta strand repeat-containing protein [Gemmatimonadaceae bacterium]